MLTRAPPSGTAAAFPPLIPSAVQARAAAGGTSSASVQAQLAELSATL